MTDIIHRIQQKTGIPDLLNRLSALSASDLSSLLLEIHRQTTAQITPPGLLSAYRNNRFTSPFQYDPVSLYRLAASLCESASQQEIHPVLLSPAAPLGSCSAFGCVDQNNVLSGTRGCETLADVSNMLAILTADRLQRTGPSASPIHLCALHPVVRAQKYAGAELFTHFHLFCIVSSGKAGGSYQCETELLAKHLLFLHTFFRQFPHISLSMVIRKRNGYSDTKGFLQRIADCIHTLLPDMPVTFSEDDMNNAYYQGMNYKIYLHTPDRYFEIGDGGFVDWVAQMSGNQKFRCLISGIGVDRILDLEGHNSFSCEKN